MTASVAPGDHSVTVTVARSDVMGSDGDAPGARAAVKEEVVDLSYRAAARRPTWTFGTPPLAISDLTNR